MSKFLKKWKKHFFWGLIAIVFVGVSYGGFAWYWHATRHERLAQELFTELRAKPTHVVNEWMEDWGIFPKEKRRDSAVIMNEIVAIGQPAVETLIRELNDPDADSASAAAAMLGHIKDPRSVDALIQVVRNRSRIRCTLDENRIIFSGDSNSLLIEAIQALGNLADPKAIEVLLEFGASKKILVKNYDFFSCTITPMNTIWQIVSENPEKLRKHQALIKSLRKIFQDESEDEFLRWQAATILEKLRDKSIVEPIITKINGWLAMPMPEESRSKYSKILASRSPPTTAEAALEKKRDEASSYCDSAVRALGDIADKRAVDTLLKILEIKEFPFDIRFGWKSLGMYTAPAALHIPTIQALGKISDARSIKPLISMLDVPVEYNQSPIDYTEMHKQKEKVNENVTKESKKAKSVAFYSANNADAWMFSVGYLLPAYVCHPIDSADIAYAAACALAEIGTPAVEALEEARNSTSSNVRDGARFALELMKKKDANSLEKSIKKSLEQSSGRKGQRCEDE